MFATNAYKRNILQSTWSKGQNGLGINRASQENYYLNRLQYYPSTFEADMATARVIYPEGTFTKEQLFASPDTPFSATRGIKGRVPVYIAGGGHSTVINALGEKEDSSHEPGSIYCDGDARGLSYEERRKVSNQQMIISWIPVWGKADNGHMHYTANNPSTYKAPRRVLQVFEHGPQFEIPGELEWKSYIIDPLFPGSYDPAGTLIPLAIPSPDRTVYLNTQSYINHVFMFTLGKLTAFDAMIAEHNEENGEHKTGYMKLPPIGLGFFLGPFREYTPLFKELFARGVQQALGARTFSNISHLEFDFFGKDSETINVTSHDTPNSHLHILHDHQISPTPISVYDFDNVPDTCIPCVTIAGDGMTFAGNGLHHDNSLDGYTGEAGGGPMIQSRRNPALLFPTQHIAFDDRGQLIAYDGTRGIGADVLKQATLSELLLRKAFAEHSPEVSKTIYLVR